MMKQRFEDQVVVVTGASRGIGSATALAFAAEGAKVVINYRSDTEGALETQSRIRAEGGSALVYQADVGKKEDVDRMVSEVEEKMGSIRVLVNNAAAFNRDSFLNVSLEEFDRSFNTNVRGLFYLSQQVARRMAARKQGAIIHISSILAQLAVPGRSVYCATKGAVEALTRAMAVELIADNIRVNAVSPGMIRTEALEAGFSGPEILANLARYIPGGRIGQTMELAQAVLFLASEDASYINGIILPVDSGMSAREAGPLPKEQN